MNYSGNGNRWEYSYAIYTKPSDKMYRRKFCIVCDKITDYNENCCVECVKAALR